MDDRDPDHGPKSDASRGERSGDRALPDSAELVQLVDVIGVPTSWLGTWTGEPMPNWVSALLRVRGSQ